MRAIRKELLLLRAEVERAEFTRARADLNHSMHRFGWLKLLLPRFAGSKVRDSGKGIQATISDWANNPLVGSLISLLLAKPLRSTLKAGSKPLLKWGALGMAAWTGVRLLARAAGRKRVKQPVEADSTE
jgi:hypothetical protein